MGREAKPTQAQDQVEITFSHIFGDENRSGLIQKYADAYMAEHPNVKINLQIATSYPENINGALLASEQGNAPHIVQIYEIGSRLALDSGIFIPVGSVATEDQLATLDDIIQPVLNYYTFDDQVWSVPFNSSNPILYYNMEILEQAGVEAVPQTYSEVLAACDKIMAAGIESLEGCIGWSVNGWFVEQWVSEQGALLANNGNGRADRATEVELDSEAMLNIFTWWKELADKDYYVYTGALEDWDGSDALFTGQQVAFHITSTADLRNITDAATEAGFNAGTAYIPIPDGVERNGTVIGGASLWLTGDHPQAELEAAVDFMLFLGKTENGVDWHKGTGYFPIRYSAIEALEAEGWFDANPTFMTAFDQLTSTIPNEASAGAVIGIFQELRTIVEQAAQSVIDGGADPAEALAAADDRADESMAEYNSLVSE
ncbi:MAG: ABC transporter substrate-binding protein [Anaerolineae bacterium]|nr:ABC transporter substrate-binding protein [Anaerolineae bacterium]